MDPQDKKNGNRKSWVDPNVEGKILRKLIKKVDKLLDKGLVVTIIDVDDEDNPDGLSKEQQVTKAVGNHFDKIIKGAHCIAQVSMAKNSMAKTSEMQKDIDMIKDHLGI